jgi:hypothetical protein
MCENIEAHRHQATCSLMIDLRLKTTPSWFSPLKLRMKLWRTNEWVVHLPRHVGSVYWVPLEGWNIVGEVFWKRISHISLNSNHEILSPMKTSSYGLTFQITEVMVPTAYTPWIYQPILLFHFIPSLLFFAFPWISTFVRPRHLFPWRKQDVKP